MYTAPRDVVIVQFEPLLLILDMWFVESTDWFVKVLRPPEVDAYFE